jgi:hypothetical protein
MKAKDIYNWAKKFGAYLLLSLLLVVFWEGIHWIVGDPLTGSHILVNSVFVLTIWGLDRVVRNYWAIIGLFLIAGLSYAFTHNTLAAWATLAVIYTLALALNDIFSRSIRTAPLRWLISGSLAITVGCLAAILTQVEVHFADEEFFVAIQAIILAAFWLLLNALRGLLNKPVQPLTVLSVCGRFAAHERNPEIGCSCVLRTHEHPISGSHRQVACSTPYQLDSQGVQPNRTRIAPQPVAAIFGLAIVFGIAGTIHVYQASFYPSQAPTYPGISAEQPFLCSKVAPDPQTYDGQDVFRRLLANIAANPYKSTPEYGFLALGTGDHHWAETFRQNLLAEAAQNLFIGPANSVKSIQYDAARRISFYVQVRDAFPGLFSPAEQETLQHWFTAINRRALTVEWVDWLYALALGQWPEGPYENQENGAGLLALLEAQKLSDPALSAVNRDYLNRNPRGWAERFRVTDDAIIYQPMWIANALFQKQYTANAPTEHIQRSFEWMLIQALPDGAPIQYNHPYSITLAIPGYMGAQLLNDAQNLWLAGRSLEYAETHGQVLFAAPGLEKSAELRGVSPTQGTCLIYGNSGMPNQMGPLAPDKIVFRDGWQTDSTYLSLNLRFTGWHRYKGTNDIIEIYQAGALVTEKLNGAAFGWLPIGRSAFRDKRIPRENLNGLVIGRDGMSAVLYTLTGIGGPWAQDPPYYATVADFKTGPTSDISTTMIENWHGWNQQRVIHFYRDGLIVVVDNADGPAGSPAAILWHLPRGKETQSGRITLREGEQPAEMVLIPAPNSALQITPEDSGLQVQVRAAGRLSVVTVFLTHDWAGAQVNLTDNILHISTTTGAVSIAIASGE